MGIKRLAADVVKRDKLYKFVCVNPVELTKLELELERLQKTAHNSDYTKSVLFQCPYDPACKCAMDEPCKGCETWHPDFA